MSQHTRDDALYIGDNGRITCGRLFCAGSSAYHTGRETSGQPLHRVTQADLDEWLKFAGEPMECENCGHTERRA